MDICQPLISSQLNSLFVALLEIEPHTHDFDISLSKLLAKINFPIEAHFRNKYVPLHDQNLNL
jgi:hypothetical protein